jgi:hypothetical protein
MTKKLRPTARRRTLRFTEEEKARIERAAKICGWQNGESATFARDYLLRSIAAILKDDRESRTPGGRLRQRLHYFQHDQSYFQNDQD